MKSFKFLVVAVALGLAACSGGFGSAGEAIDNSPAAVGTDSDELGEAAQLMGSYQAKTGTLLGLVLAKKDGNRVFVADQQVWCFKAPCFPVHLEGSWTALDGRLTLTENANKHVYDYTLADGALALADPTTAQKVSTFAKVQTWCGQSSDCALQKVAQPMSSASDVVCSAEQACVSSSAGEPGYGDACEASCLAGLTCQAGFCAP